MEKIIKIKPKILSRSSIIYLIFLTFRGNLSLCSPLAFNAGPLPLIAIPPSMYHPGMHGSASPMLLAGHYDPYAPVPAPEYAAPWSHFDVANRRSLPGVFGGASLLRGDRPNGGERDRNNQNEEPSDEQKALDGLPLSFIEPDPPSTITERISESFSALGEGVKNHFRSISENFSDTMDDIRDAWRPAPSNGDNNASRKADLKTKRKG